MLSFRASSPAPAAAAALAACRSLVFRRLGGAGAAFLLGLGLEQGLTVGDRDLIVVGMNFGKGQEAVAIAAVIDEGRLQRRLNARYLGEVDIASELLLIG